MSLRNLRNKVSENGYTYDKQVPKETFENALESLHQTHTTIVTKYWPEAKSYRDNKKFNSVHVQDYRHIERENMEGDIVGHLEKFNPEYHPILHTLIDMPIWFFKNRVLERRNL